MSSKLGKKSQRTDFLQVTVRLLEDDSFEEVDVPDDATGKWLFEEVCRRQDIIQEKEYFGLRYLDHDILSPPTKRWINISRGVLAQLSNTHPRVVSFRFKHYPNDPLCDLKLPKTHYLLYRQLRRDLGSGRLVSSEDVVIRLAALVVQVELGDSSVQDLPQISIKSNTERSYLSGFHVVHNQSQRIEALIMEEHKKLEGLHPSEAAMEMIQFASSLDTYGIDPVRVKAKIFDSRPIHLGLTHKGVAVFVCNRCEKLYPWSNITWITYGSRNFVLSVTKQASAKGKKSTETVRFKCENKAVARSLWEWASDRQLFLTLEKSAGTQLVKSKRGFSLWSHTFKFSGRCRREVLSRPTLSATLPLDSSTRAIESVDDFLSNQIPSPAHQSVSMVALENEALLMEHNLQPIGELDSPKAVKTTVQLESTSYADFQFPSPASMSYSHFSTMRTALSEPIRRNLSGLDSESGVEDNRPIQPNRISSVCRGVDSSQLAPFFDDLPRRRCAPETSIQQQKVRMRNFSGAGHNINALPKDSDDLFAEATVNDLHATAEAGRAWAEAADQNRDLPGTAVQAPTTFSFWPSFLRTSSPRPQSPSVAQKLVQDHDICSMTSSSEQTGSSLIVSCKRDSDVSAGSGVWHAVVLSAGCLTGATLLGLAVLLEAELHSPLVTALRQHPWVLDFDARVYRPFRSALFGFWRR